VKVDFKSKHLVFLLHKRPARLAKEDEALLRQFLSTPIRAYRRRIDAAGERQREGQRYVTKLGGSEGPLRRASVRCSPCIRFLPTGRGIFSGNGSHAALQVSSLQDAEHYSSRAAAARLEDIADRRNSYLGNSMPTRVKFRKTKHGSERTNSFASIGRNATLIDLFTKQ
jgi:hypothetical protein